MGVGVGARRAGGVPRPGLGRARRADRTAWVARSSPRPTGTRRTEGVSAILLHHAAASPRSGPFWARHGYRPLLSSWAQVDPRYAAEAQRPRFGLEVSRAPRR